MNNSASERGKYRRLLYLMSQAIDKSTFPLSETDKQDIKNLIFTFRKYLYHRSRAEQESKILTQDLILSYIDEDIPQSCRTIARQMIDNEENEGLTGHPLHTKIAQYLKGLDLQYQIITGIEIVKEDKKHYERFYIMRPPPGTIMDLAFWNERLRRIGKKTRVLRPIKYAGGQITCGYAENSL